MLTETKDHRQIELRHLNNNDFDNLLTYLNHLSHETKRRFGPHPFDEISVRNFYLSSCQYQGFIAVDTPTNAIVAYAVIKRGFLVHDQSRLLDYGIKPDDLTDCTFAPSVGDLWQNAGVGKALLKFIISEIKTAGIKRMILWGGVQSDNERAKNYYLKAGFKVLGHFEYYGENEDMILDLNT